MNNFRCFTAALACGLLACSAAARAEPSFKGKTIDVILGSTSGGGTDGTTRLIGRFMEKYLPGTPTMRYRNLPGGHGSKALNYFATSIKSDGLAWGSGSNAQIDANNLKKSTTKFDPTKFVFFGGASRGGSIVVINSAKMKNLTDKSLAPVVVGDIDGSRRWVHMIMFGQETLGWNVRYVIGYPGTSHLELAMRRGEVDMIGMANVRLIKEMVDTGQFRAAVQMSNPSNSGGVQGRSDFLDVPVFDNLVDGKLTGQTKDSFEFWAMQSQMATWYALPPGTPGETAQAYRTAYDKMIEDPEFIKNAHMQFSEDFLPLHGSFVETLVAKTSYPSDEIIGYLQHLKIKNNLPAEGLSDEQLAALAKEKGFDRMPSIQTTLQQVNGGGRQIAFTVDGKEQTAEVSGTRTQLTIGGKKAAREELKSGLVCEVSYPGDKLEASAIACR